MTEKGASVPEAVLVVEGVDRLTYDMIEDAAFDLQNGCLRMREWYLGLKDYDRFTGQREDHRYGFGPRHGTIVARIGLTTEARKRPLTAEEVAAGMAHLERLAEAVPATRRGR
ncbi:MAG TPA: hypothetical protein VFB19_18530 [Mycobacterium sp.]|nr:hypothetical protein [Mycobacterium sp.]